MKLAFVLLVVFQLSLGFDAREHTKSMRYDRKDMRLMLHLVDNWYNKVTFDDIVRLVVKFWRVETKKKAEPRTNLDWFLRHG